MSHSSTSRSKMLGFSLGHVDVGLRQGTKGERKS